jgi:hypothetical protein
MQIKLGVHNEKKVLEGMVLNLEEQDDKPKEQDEEDQEQGDEKNRTKKG